ncbi:MAG: COX15/CtaA family protein [Chthoniobacterales bacterium]
MSRSFARAPWLNRFAWLLAGCTLFLICSGGMVTSKGVGLSVPDWPTTFGYNMFLFPVSQWVGGIFFEHTHRLAASAIGLLTIILAVWLWRVESRKWLRVLGIVALGAVILQGVLGGLRVTLLKDEIGIFHACLAQAFFGLLVLIAVATSKSWNERMAEKRGGSALWFPIVATALIYLQLGLGATMRHQHRDLAILDFPAAYGSVIPDTSPKRLAEINQMRDARALSDVTAGQIWLQLVHRFGALLVTIGVVASWFIFRRGQGHVSSRLKNLSTVWVGSVFCQITLGAWTIWSNKAADIATAHVAMGATLLALGIGISALSWRQCHNSGEATQNALTSRALERAHAL